MNQQGSAILIVNYAYLMPVNATIPNRLLSLPLS